MKKHTIIILLLFLFTFQIGFAQDLSKCREVVRLTVESINNKSAEKLKNHLSEDFKIAGQTGEIAKNVIKQLFTQLGETVKSYNEISKSKADGKLILDYTIDYEKMGKKDATFIFNTNNKLEELSLFKMEVKTLGDTKVENNNNDIIKIPFRMAGNLIVVDVILNGTKRAFLLDSGSPKVILNSKYISLTDSAHKKISSSKGVSGSIPGMDIQYIESLDWYGIQLNNQKIITLDISHLEESLEAEEIYGLIGFDLIKDYDILYDYENLELTLIKPEYYEEFKQINFQKNKLSVVPFELSNHIPIIKARVGNKTLLYGIDCGAESNLIDDNLFDELKKSLNNITDDELLGAENIPRKVKKGNITLTDIGGKKFENLGTLFSDISHLNDGYKLNLDGLIGYEVLSKQKTLISFNRKEMVFVE